MRLWSIHPGYLDAKGIVALWRESLLAQKVLLGKTKGYRKHPQLDRFKNHKNPVKAIGAYLKEIYKDSIRRGYNFNRQKIKYFVKLDEKIPVASGQLEYEFDLLKKKLKKRDVKKLNNLKKVKNIEPNPVFKIFEGGVESWEKIKT